MKDEDSQDFSDLDPISYDLEDDLRYVFIQNQESLLEDLTTIDSTSYVSVKELETVDVVMIGDDGSIYLTETKLARNSDARKVIAQILDYYAEFKRKSFDEFLQDWQRKSGKTLMEHLEEKFDNPENIMKQVENNWEKGRFIMMVVMDQLRVDIKNMGRLMRENNFLLYGLEIEKYELEGRKILDSKVWNEVVETSSSYTQELPDYQEFIDNYSKEGFQQQISELVQLHRKLGTDLDISSLRTEKTPKYLKFQFTDNLVGIGLHKDPEYEGKSVKIWSKNPVRKKLREILMQYQVELQEEKKANSGVLTAKWPIEDLEIGEFEEALRRISGLIDEE